jgi:hypothetical protein
MAPMPNHPRHACNEPRHPRTQQRPKSVGARMQRSIGACIQHYVGTRMQRSIGACSHKSAGGRMQGSIGTSIQQSIGAWMQQPLGSLIHKSVCERMQGYIGTMHRCMDAKIHGKNRHPRQSTGHPGARANLLGTPSPKNNRSQDLQRHGRHTLVQTNLRIKASSGLAASARSQPDETQRNDEHNRT